jgi:tetratricopeptide (TPR) repeat protein
MSNMLWIIIFFISAVSLVYYHIQKLEPSGLTKKPVPKKKNPHLERALVYADRIYSDKRYLAAEKAYLEVIKIDHKNATAYNRLGRIYLELKNFPDAIECCQIVTQIEPSAPAFFNLGTVLFENKSYTKAISAFERSIAIKPSAVRYMGLAKTHQRLSNTQKAVEYYEKAVELDASLGNQNTLLAAYKLSNNTEKAKLLEQQLNLKSKI